MARAKDALSSLLVFGARNGRGIIIGQSRLFCPMCTLAKCGLLYPILNPLAVPVDVLGVRHRLFSRLVFGTRSQNTQISFFF